MELAGDNRIGVGGDAYFVRHYFEHSPTDKPVGLTGSQSGVRRHNDKWAMNAPPPQPPTTPEQPLVLIVTGPPASGKTTIGRPLALALGLPFLSKDLFKESLFDSLGGSDREWSRRIGLASTQLLFRCAEVLLEAGQSCALESNFYPQWDTAPLRELQTRFGCRFVQVVCAADVPLLVERFTRRARSGERHPGHADAFALDELIPRIVNERWDALELDGPVIHVDTTRDSADVHQLIRDIRHLIDEHAAD
jgi:predicted kinase